MITLSTESVVLAAVFSAMLSCIVVSLAGKRWSASDKFLVLFLSMLAISAITTLQLIFGVWRLFLVQPTLFATDTAVSFGDIFLIAWVAVAVPAIAIVSIRIVFAERQTIRPALAQRIKANDHGRLIVDPECNAPYVLGLLRPRIFVPSDYENWPANHRRYVSIHEQRHVQRRDIAFKYVADLLCCLMWFNPVFWFLNYRLSVLREKACDNAVLCTGVNPIDYCEVILTAAKHAYQNPRHSVAFGSRSSLRGRTSQILQKVTPVVHALRNRFFPPSFQERIFDIVDPQVQRRELPTFRRMIIVIVTLVLSNSAFAIPFFGGIERKTSTLDFPIRTTTDDAEEFIENGIVDLDSRDLEICTDFRRSHEQLIGLRFARVTVPRRAKINSAELVFTGYRSADDSFEAQRNASVFCEVILPIAPDGETFSRRKFDISRRITNDAMKADWTIEAPWRRGQRDEFTTVPSLRDAVQRIVDLEQWQPGNAIVCIISCSRYDSYRRSASFDNVGELPPPVLRVGFE